MPIVLGVAGVAAAVLAARVLKREWDRINRELDAADEPRGATLRRDPATGEWRPR